jgi:hypothetical protein
LPAASTIHAAISAGFAGTAPRTGATDVVPGSSGGACTTATSPHALSATSATV